MTTNEPPIGPADDQNSDGAPPPPPPATPQSPYPPPGSDFGSGGYPPPPPPSDSGFVPPFSAPDALSYGWNKFSANVGQWLLAGLVFLAVSVLFGILSWIVQPDAADAGANPFGSFNVGTIVVNLLSTIVGWIVTAIAYRGALDETEGRKFVLGDAVSRILIGPVILTSLLVGVGTTIGMFLCLLPGIVFAFLSFFSMLFVIDKNQSPVEAITSSVKLVTANIGQSLLLALLALLAIIAGACLCGLGLFVAYPVVAIAAACAYKRFQNQPVA